MPDRELTIDTGHETLHSWRWMVEVFDEVLTDHDATEDTLCMYLALVCVR